MPDPLPRVDTCAGCRYWQKSFDTKRADGQVLTFGQCRRHSPKLTYQGRTQSADFPPMPADGWCGEWRGAAG